jgi:hypothetical protein
MRQLLELALFLGPFLRTPCTPSFDYVILQHASSTQEEGS